MTAITSSCRDCGKPFEHAGYAKYGACCRGKRQYRQPRKYTWSPEKDALIRERYGKPGAAQALAGKFGYPKRYVNLRAIELGLARARETRLWTPEDDAHLETHCGARTVHRLARDLKRTAASVASRIKRLGISARVREGYSLNDLVVCFGVNEHVIAKWVRLRLLRGNRQQDTQATTWAFSSADILRFIQEHPSTFRLDRVDQTWFLDLVFNTVADACDGNKRTRIIGNDSIKNPMMRDQVAHEAA